MSLKSNLLLSEEMRISLLELDLPISIEQLSFAELCFCLRAQGVQMPPVRIVVDEFTTVSESDE